MTHANALMLRAMYDGVGQGDLDPLIASLTDDVSWIDSTLGPLAGNSRARTTFSDSLER